MLLNCSGLREAVLHYSGGKYRLYPSPLLPTDSIFMKYNIILIFQCACLAVSGLESREFSRRGCCIYKLKHRFDFPESMSGRIRARIKGVLSQGRERSKACNFHFLQNPGSKRTGIQRIRKDPNRNIRKGN